MCCWDSKLLTCCGLADAGRIGIALAGAALLLPLTKLDKFAIPISATIAINPTITGVLFFSGEGASGCWGTVAGWF